MKVLILGSCVTRDAFEFAGDYPPLTLHGYYARSALVSATDARPFPGVPLERIQSPFQRRMVQWDITGAALAEIAKADYDLLVYDAIDERYPGAGLVERSQEPGPALPPQFERLVAELPHLAVTGWVVAGGPQFAGQGGVRAGLVHQFVS